MNDIGMWLQLICVLAVVVALAYLVLHKGLGSLMRLSQSQKLLQIKERVALDHKRSVYVVEIDRRRFLIGGGDAGLSLIAELEATQHDTSH